MYVDGHCPHYSWEHSFDLAPSATCVIAVLLDELRADAKPGGKQTAKGNKKDNISPVTGKPRGPILAPTSHALPLPACVVAGLVLPAKDAFTLAPEATAQHMQVSASTLPFLHLSLPLHFLIGEKSLEN